MADIVNITLQYPLYLYHFYSDAYALFQRIILSGYSTQHSRPFSSQKSLIKISKNLLTKEALVCYTFFRKTSVTSAHLGHNISYKRIKPQNTTAAHQNSCALYGTNCRAKHRTPARQAPRRATTHNGRTPDRKQKSARTPQTKHKRNKLKGIIRHDTLRRTLF